MRRILLVSACLGVLVFAGASTALARGPHFDHRPPGVRHGHHHRGGPWYNSYYRGRGGRGGRYYGHRRGYAAYRPYPVCGPVYAPYQQSGFGIGGRNFSFWYQR